MRKNNLPPLSQVTTVFSDGFGPITNAWEFERRVTKELFEKTSNIIVDLKIQGYTYKAIAGHLGMSYALARKLGNPGVDAYKARCAINIKKIEDAVGYKPYHTDQDLDWLNDPRTKLLDFTVLAPRIKRIKQLLE